MTNKEEEIIAQEKATFVFGLPLTEEEKQTIIDILRKDFVWKEMKISHSVFIAVFKTCPLPEIPRIIQKMIAP